MTLLVISSFLMTHLQATTGNLPLWSWMFLMGLGIGPSMAGFTVVVQNAVPMSQLGVATSTLTFLRQIGGSVGLAIAGTLFSQAFTQKLPGRLLAHGVPAQVVHGFTTNGSRGGQGNLTGVNLGAQLAHQLPPQLRPVIPNIVAGIHDAFSLAIGEVFWLTFASGVVALLVVLILPDLRLHEQSRFSAVASDAVPGSEVPVHSGKEAAAQ
jgi:hypothetical protein